MLTLCSLASHQHSANTSSVANTEGEIPVTDAPSPFPIVINTWPFTNATQRAWEVISTKHTDSSEAALDAVVAGCTECEFLQCDGTVGYGGSPDSTGETTLDAMIMDGTAMDVGAVGDLRHVKDAIKAARLVMEHTQHTLLAGDMASQFAIQMGLESHNLTTAHSEDIFFDWKKKNCQPNYYRNVVPQSTTSCGPYSPAPSLEDPPRKSSDDIRADNHDTISMLVIDQAGKHIVSGTSTNGANHKVAGRVGDGPIMGAGSYADSDVGACGATGDGDVMMRFLPCYQAVENMRNGMSPTEAAVDAMKRIENKYKDFQGGMITVNKKGEYGAGKCCNLGF